MHMISIIMTCFNGELFLDKSINSILSQTYKNWELIFVDNNSSDSSKQKILSFHDRRIKYFKLNQTVNLGTVRKYAFDKCTGKYVSFLDVDDYWDETKLEKQVSKFIINKNIDLVYTNYYQFNKNEKKKIKKELFSGNCQKEIIQSYIYGKPLTAWLTLMIKKELIEKLDYSFDEYLHICSDFDLIIRLSKDCYFDYDEGFLGYYRLHSANESKKPHKEIRELSYIIKKYYNDKNITRLLQTNNFADKIFIKDIIYRKLFEKKMSNQIYFKSISYKILSKILEIMPKSIIKLFI